MNELRRQRVRRATLFMMTGGVVTLGVMGIWTLPTLGDYILPSVALVLCAWFFAAVIYVLLVPLKTGEFSIRWNMLFLAGLISMSFYVPFGKLKVAYPPLMAMIGVSAIAYLGVTIAPFIARLIDQRSGKRS